ncbi:MAG: hypothetical protein AB1894_29395 [Chloroflexota bacterium]
MALKITDDDDESGKNKKSRKIDNAKSIMERLVRNSYCLYFHYLPKTEMFIGGFVNFRKIGTYNLSDFKRAYENPSAQISSAFIKDVIARFSTYYARQGQPDFEFDSLTL